MTQENLTMVPGRVGNRHREKSTNDQQKTRTSDTNLSMHVCIEGVLCPFSPYLDQLPAKTLTANSITLEKILQSFPSIQVSFHTRRLNKEALAEIFQKLPTDIQARFTTRPIEHLHTLWSMPEELNRIKTSPEIPLICVEHSWTSVPDWAIPWTFMVHPYFGLSEARAHLALTCFINHIFVRTQWAWK